MFTPETTAFLESGCSLIVGTVDALGAPSAARAWGLTVLSRDVGECRLLLDAASTQVLDDLSRSGLIAVTAADVPTLRSIQLKGDVVAVEAATDADRERSAQYCHDFFNDVNETDGTDPEILYRMAAQEVVACVVRFTELYDQTPGPVAGAPLDASRT